VRDPRPYDFPMTSPPSESPASPVDAAKTWKRRARIRWRIAALFGIFAVILLVSFLLLALNRGSIPIPCPPDGCPVPQADPWVAVSALGTLAAGIGAVISAIAAMLAVRAAATVQNITPAPSKEQKATTAAKKPSARRRTRR
jgi:hypothetical protein